MTVVYYKNRYEGFANYQSNCSYARAITNALKKETLIKLMISFMGLLFTMVDIRKM